MAEMKICFPLRTQVPEGTRRVGVGLNNPGHILEAKRWRTRGGEQRGGEQNKREG